MSDFPRGWSKTIIASGLGATPLIVMPATPGVIHVLDVLDAKLVAFGATALYGPTVVVTSNAQILLQWQLIVAGAAGAVSQDELAASGLEIAGFAGQDLTVTINTTLIANTTMNLLAQGHDV